MTGFGNPDWAATHERATNTAPLGSDTAGSVRVAAPYCGILGFRPSHGAIPVVGVIPMAQSFDTVGMQSLFDSLTSLLLMICNSM
jgi:Asp-tRNA(Asn)/Glu-tRNA(Gln) amidotransferase A subunit family amidase